MPFINMNLTDAKKPAPVPEDTYLLTIEDAEQVVDDKGRTKINVRLRIENPPADYPNPPAIFHTLWFPGQDDEPGKINTKKLFIQAFFNEFSIPYDDSGFDLDDFLGKQAELPVKVTQWGDREPRNEIVLTPW